MTNFKPSGVDWIGDIPNNWDVTRFRHVFRESKEVNGSSPVGEMLSVSGYKGVVPKVYESESLKRDDDQLETYRVVRKGQLAVNTMWLNYAGLGISEFEGHMSPAYRAYWVSNKVHGRYMHHLLRSQLYVNAYTACLTGVRPNSLQMSRDNLMSFPILLPPFEEQQAIADSLDRELERIDGLIKKQQEMVALLEEKQRDLIEQHVSGLNSAGAIVLTNDKIWPRIAAGFELVPLKHALAMPITDGPHETPEFLDEGIEFISAEAVSSGEINFENRRGYISELANREYSKKYSPRLHDIYMIKSGATTGRSAILREERPFNIWSPLAVLRSMAGVNPFYLHYAVQSTSFQKSISLAWSFGTQQNIGMGALGQLKIPLPALEIQNAITSSLDRSLGDLKNTIAKARDLNLVLAERRSALISEAVTGKIDLRGKK